MLHARLKPGLRRERGLEGQEGGGSRHGLFTRAERRPAPVAGLGARLRGERDPARRARVGRARRDAVPDPAGSGEGGHLQPAVPRPDDGRPDGAGAADRHRGAVLGRRRHRHGDHGHGPRRRGDRRQRHAGADGRVGAAVLRHRERRQAGRVLRLGAGRRVRRLGAQDARRLRRGEGRVDAERAEDVDQQRRHRVGARRRRVGRSGAGHARPGVVRRRRRTRRACGRA